MGQDSRIEAISLFTGIGGLELGGRRLGKPLNSHVVSLFKFALFPFCFDVSSHYSICLTLTISRASASAAMCLEVGNRNLM